MNGWHVRTMSVAFQEIHEGEQPWTALGNFLNYWFAYAKDQRPDLVSEPLPEVPEGEYDQRWAAYCAASVEHLCNKYAVPCPEWVYDQKFVLHEPWYKWPHRPVPDWLISSTPTEFSKRNIYSGDSMFDNKWELAEKYRPMAEARRMERRRKKQQRRRFLVNGIAAASIALAACLLLYRLFHSLQRS